MKIDELHESTTAGSVAPVAMPMNGGDAIKRGTGVYKPKKGGNLLTGKKTSKKYANSLHESKMKQIAMDLETMQDGNFKQKYGKTKEKMMSLLGTPSKLKPNSVSEVNETEGTNKFSVTYYNPKLDKNVTKTVKANNLSDVWNMCANKGLEVIRVQAKDAKISEAHLEEEDLILIPGQGHKLKTGFHAFDPDKAEHEGETLKNSLRTIIRNAQELHTRLENSDQFPEWVSEKIGQIKGMMTGVTEYLISNQKSNEGVIAGGAGNFEEAAKGLWANIHAKRERIKHGSGERMRKPGSKGAPTAQDFKDAANEDEMTEGTGAWETRRKTDEGDVVPFRRNSQEDEYNKLPPGVLQDLYKCAIISQKIMRNPSAMRDHQLIQVLGDTINDAGEKLVNAGYSFEEHFRDKSYIITSPTGEEIKLPWADAETRTGWAKRLNAISEGIKEKIKGAIRREKAKDLPLIQTRRDYASGKAGEAYSKGETRKGNQYSAWAERDRKKKGDPTTNPEGTYRTKTSDYTNESKYGKGMRDCCDSPAQKNQPHVKGCKNYAPTSADRKADMERHNAETIPGYKRNKDIN